MPTDIIPLLSFVLIATFSPGPSNVSSASMGVLHGYQKTLTYLWGLAAGAFFMLFVSGLVSTWLLNVLPAFDPILRLVGAGYILYLATGILKANYTFHEDNLKPMGFVQGLLLQLLNPKLVVYGLTLFSAFLAPIAQDFVLLVLATVLLTAVTFLATSTWALFGAAIKIHLHQPRVTAIVNIIFALFLVYSAIDLAGIL